MRAASAEARGVCGPPQPASKNAVANITLPYLTIEPSLIYQTSTRGGRVGIREFTEAPPSLYVPVAADGA